MADIAVAKLHGRVGYVLAAQQVTGMVHTMRLIKGIWSASELLTKELFEARGAQLTELSLIHI